MYVKTRIHSMDTFFSYLGIHFFKNLPSLQIQIRYNNLFPTN